jgi:hypothetical protein
LRSETDRNEAAAAESESLPRVGPQRAAAYGAAVDAVFRKIESTRADEDDGEIELSASLQVAIEDLVLA